MEDYYLIRKKVIVDGLNQREAAKALGRSRKTIKKALKHIEPPGYRRTQTPFCPVIFPVAPIIDSWLEEDKGKPRKQRHMGWSKIMIWRKIKVWEAQNNKSAGKEMERCALMLKNAQSRCK